MVWRTEGRYVTAVWQKCRFHCSADTFPAEAVQVVVHQTLVLRTNICGKNRQLRQGRKPLTAILKRYHESNYIYGIRTTRSC